MQHYSPCQWQHNRENVEHFSYLGVTLSTTMNWNEHVAILSSKINKRLGLLRRIRHLLPHSARLLFYNCLVLPLFDYGDLLCLFLWNLPLEVFFDCLKVVALAPVAGGLVVRNTHVVHEITGMGKIKGLFHSVANKY